MAWTDAPLTLASIVTSWRWDTAAIVVPGVLAVGYQYARGRARRRTQTVPAGRLASFAGLGLGVWLLTGISVIGVYSDTLFWVRALQTLLLLYVVPFGLAAGQPVTVLRDALGPQGQARLDRVVRSSLARALTFPLVPSVAVLAAPWLLFLTPWYELVLRHGPIDALTRLLLVAIGFVYFYSRLQTDPVPQRFSQSISLLITVFESLADGILGLVLWWGPLVAADYYAEIGRTWGPDPRMDQIIGAGVLWVLGDVLGLPYLLSLMRSWASDERRRAAEIDAELDAAEADPRPPRSPRHASVAVDEEPPTTGLWWENDPQLRARFRR
ncbi:cytochrome c oxidase assembly protein [Nocardia transvalensis]|uniref:cytochrome c oxidase assembly protein n=1 Tax=Nocardia transvalensis TaxID=37333 RepID=UPI001892E840|nr:cytochrome c oxidase assembly protein [Nocardia transvalensis]MBF6329647.1 cytochrome c oxidase assembly protein [Nocardia transvalensis]